MRRTTIFVLLSFFVSAGSDIYAKPRAESDSTSRIKRSKVRSKVRLEVKEEQNKKDDSASSVAGAPNDEISVKTRGPTRIDFDDRLIQGQTNKSGAVYLFDRKELEIRSMVKQRTGFRDQIIKDVLKE
jgi:hypothetical protein